MSNRKSVVGAGVTAFIWLAVAAFLFVMRSTDYFLFTMGVIVALTFAFSYNLLQSLDESHAHRTQTRVDRFLKSLNTTELKALRDRVGGGAMDDGEYGSLDDLLMENEVKLKRR